MSYKKIIIRPLFTEKMSRLEELEKKYAFEVLKGSNKIEIAFINGRRISLSNDQIKNYLKYKKKYGIN